MLTRIRDCDIYLLVLTALLVLISITMSVRRGVSGGVGGGVRVTIFYFFYFVLLPTGGDALAPRAKPCRCNKVLYTVESSASPVIRLLAGSTLGGGFVCCGGASSHPMRKVYTVIAEPRRTLICGVAQQKQTSVAHACSPVHISSK